MYIFKLKKVIKGLKGIRKAGLTVVLWHLAYSFAGAQAPKLGIWFDQPAGQWEQTLPLGNGRLGMTPDGGVDTEHIVLNDITLWSGAEQDANNYSAYTYLPKIRKLLFAGKNVEAQALVDQHFICTGKGSASVPFGCYQVLGDLKITFDYGGGYRRPVETSTQYKHYSRSLDLQKAVADCSFELNGIHYRREYFCSFADDVNVIRLTADKKGKISCKVAVSRQEKGNVSIDNGILQMQGHLDNGTDGQGMRYLASVKAIPDGGEITASAKAIEVKGANSVLIFVSAGTDYEGAAFKHVIDSLLNHAAKVPYATQKQAHMDAFRKLFDRATLQIGDSASDKYLLPIGERLAAFQKDPDADKNMAALFFQFGRYLSISSTRVGLLPPNLQGLWANQIQTPWNGDYHLDVNVEMNHWPLDVANLSELELPLADLVERMVSHGEKTAKAYYNARGWVAHVITNPWLFTEPGESASWGVTKSGSGWLCNNLWQYYAFTTDRAYLKKIYPVLKGSAIFYNDMLVKDPATGWLVTSPSSSPENSFYLPNGKTASICMGPTIDNQIIRELFGHVITAAKILDVDQALRDSLAARLKEVPPVARIAPDGRIMEWLKDYTETDPHHRHVSHLYGLYPANLITPEKTPKLATAAAKTLEARGDDGPGWSIAYKMLWWARLYKGNHAFKLLKDLLRPTLDTHMNYGAGGGVYPNLFSAGPPFQIDANFGGEAGIAEMLLQSHDGFINLLPALPDSWAVSGKVTGFKARNNFTVDFKWRMGKVTSYSVYSNRPRPVRIKVNGEIKNIWSKQRSGNVPGKF